VNTSRPIIEVPVKVGEAVAQFTKADDSLGWEVVVQHRIEADEIHKTRQLDHVIGWRFFPKAMGSRFVDGVLTENSRSPSALPPFRPTASQRWLSPVGENKKNTNERLRADSRELVFSC
jgi:hypothetical protein